MLKPYPLFGDHCVFPMDRELRIFGEADNGKTIHAALSASDGTVLGTGCCAVHNGRFLVLLPAISSPAVGLTLTLTDSDTTITSTDIAVGFVFLAGGQSNMELSLWNADEGRQLIETHDDPDLRWYMVPKESIPERADAAQANCHWSPMAPGSDAEMSAIGYFFAAKLRRLLHVPVGIVGCYWGGTSVTAWTDEPALRRIAEGTRYLDEYAALSGDKSLAQWLEEDAAFQQELNDWNNQIAALKEENPAITWDQLIDQAGQCPWHPPVGPGSPYRPANLAETMLKHVIPAAITAFLYYQGEDDTTRTTCYDLLLENMIRRWRELFRNQELPFINVQLPMWIDRNATEDYTWPRTRMAQERAWRNTRATALTCLIDCGEWDNIHPTDKRTPGERLADEYLALTGDKAAQYRLPPAVTGKSTIGSKMILPTSQPVHTVNGPADLFELAGEDGVFYPATAVIRNDSVIELTAPEVSNPVAARYAYVSYAKVHVFGDNGMPLRPFELGTEAF